MKNNFLILILFLFSINLYSQDRIKVNLYSNTDSYLKSEYSWTNVIAETKEIGDNYIWVKKIINPETSKKIGKANRAWVLEYNGENYFNLGYSSDMNNWKVFIKFNIEGKLYCASFINKNSAPIVKNSGGSYGGGLQGVIISESIKWGKNWFDKKGFKTKILFIDLNKRQLWGSSKNVSIGDFLTKKELKEKFNLEATFEEIKNMKIESITELIKKKNAS